MDNNQIIENNGRTTIIESEKYGRCIFERDPDDFGYSIDYVDKKFRIESELVESDKYYDMEYTSIILENGNKIDIECVVGILNHNSNYDGFVMDEIKMKDIYLKNDEYLSVIVYVNNKNNYDRIDYFYLWCDKYLKMIIKKIEIDIKNMLINGTTVDKLVDVINKL